MQILGIESSCDETSAAIVTDARKILGHTIRSQLSEHEEYGGVVPEIASRAHITHIRQTIEATLKEADMDLQSMDGIAVTSGPGLIGGLIVGLMVAKGMAAASQKPLIAVNHLEGHALTARLTHDIPFPYLLLLVSGGHCQILVVEGVGQYRPLGSTLDDAVGEAFDKTAKMLGLGYPGGPLVEAQATLGNPDSIPLPRPMLNRDGCDFSFSGLKTAVFHAVDAFKQRGTHHAEEKACFTADLCASFQKACGDILSNRMTHAIHVFQQDYLNGRPTHTPAMVVSGGVAANQYLRERLSTVAESHRLALIAPPLKLCTDNGAMIAWAGLERLRLGLSDPLNVTPRPRWPLKELGNT